MGKACGIYGAPLGAPGSVVLWVGQVRKQKLIKPRAQGHTDADWNNQNQSPVWGTWCQTLIWEAAPGTWKHSRGWG